MMTDDILTKKVYSTITNSSHFQRRYRHKDDKLWRNYKILFLLTLNLVNNNSFTII